ncbi:leucine-rich repeat extensin-like protein 3 [Tripterygium wilfordii]|uniref:leucine-rich repeat extensin-like protein 3 n=1 Tax=Tripterygium wilfordii TaxID=458696 RepID=UPI0018F813F8|nr:leucine-rich repeat extensin-like protein 3 [Tripterygium wilfordii]
MGCLNTLNPLRKKWLGLLVKVTVLVTVMVARANSEDQTGLLCVSDCGTCPVICSPPPSPVKSHTPPPHSSLPPPPPPPLLTPIYQSPPQSYYHSPPPPAPRPPPPSPPVPSSNTPIIVVPTPPSSSNSPPSGHAPPTAGPLDYAFPYYYFYASKASNLCYSLPYGL